MNVSDFRAKFPEFNPVQGDSYIQLYLDEAARSIDQTLAGSRFDDLHGYLAAHLLAISPHGKNARLTPPKDGKTTYYNRYQQIGFELTAGLAKVV